MCVGPRVKGRTNDNVWIYNEGSVEGTQWIPFVLSSRASEKLGHRYLDRPHMSRLSRLRIPGMNR